MRLSELEVDTRRREEERILESFYTARTGEEEVARLAVVACYSDSDPYAYLDNLNSDKEKEDDD